MDKRFIEVSFPIKEVSKESAREKNIRHGHISTLHIWWARRPLSSSRTTNYASLIPASKNTEEYKKKRNFIIDLSKWENILNKSMIEKAKKHILNANNGKSPKILDPFDGGGAIPLEALRLGCETYASDYNPVAVFIEKCTLEYPQRFGEKLVKDVKKWGEWVLEKAKEEISEYYPYEKKEIKGYFTNSIEQNIPIAYIWTRTIKCQNPLCESEIPLMRQFWLVKKQLKTIQKKIALYPYIKEDKVELKVVGVGDKKLPYNFDPNNGTVTRANAKCLVCGTVVEAKDVKKSFQNEKVNQRIVAVVLQKPGSSDRKYRIATKKDMDTYREAEKQLEMKVKALKNKWGINPIPDEPIPPKESHRAVGSQLPLYNFKTWGDLFNSRQKLALIVFTEKVRQAYEEMVKEGFDKEYAKIVVSYLGLGLSRMVDYYNSLCLWDNVQERTVHVFKRQTLPMVWDYSELNPISSTVGSWESMAFRRIWKVLEFLIHESVSAKVIQSSATSLPYEDDFFDAIFTDPPYYDNVPYSYLSDLFYVWLKRALGYLYPEFFSTPLTPKTKEIVVYANRPGGKEKANLFFESMLKKSFEEIFRVLKPNGIASIVYAHKTTPGWEAVINALIDSGLTVTASWPIDTEMKSRLLARGTAALASSIYIITRKIKKQGVGLFPEVRKELRSYLNDKLEQLWLEGISGGDFFISSIGSGIEIFSKYEKIIDFEGNELKANKLLEEIRIIAANFAIKQIFYDGFTEEISSLTRLYILWRWNFGEAKIHFDEARKLAQSFGINLEQEWNKGFVKKEREFIRLKGPKARKIQEIESSSELIDILHYVLLLWEKGEKDKINNILSNSLRNNEILFKVAQAISHSLPNDNKEKRLIDGFLSGKERIKEYIKELKPKDSLERFLK